jgi:hypothetical protein
MTPEAKLRRKIENAIFEIVPYAMDNRDYFDYDDALPTIDKLIKAAKEFAKQTQVLKSVK